MIKLKNKLARDWSIENAMKSIRGQGPTQFEAYLDGFEKAKELMLQVVKDKNGDISLEDVEKLGEELVKGELF